MTGLRTGEALALRWVNVDLDAREIRVRESVKGPLKTKRSKREVPIADGILPVLREWKVKTGGADLVVPALRRDSEKIDKHTPGREKAGAAL